MYRLQDYFEKDVEPPLPSELLDRGDFNIFVEGVNRNDVGVGLVRTAVPSAFPGEPEPTKLNYVTNHAIDEFMRDSPFDQIPASDRFQDISARSSLESNPRFPGQGIIQIPPVPAIPPVPGVASIIRKPLPGSARASMDTDTTMGSAHTPSSSIGSMNGVARGQFPGMSDIYRTPSQRSRPGTGVSGHSIPASPAVNTSLPSPVARDHVMKRAKPSYSWNEVVDRENLGVRPGEVEILSKDFEIMWVHEYISCLP